MFEDSLLDSAKQLKAGRTRWMVAASLGVQAAIVAGFVVVPLLWPAVLPVVVAAPKMVSVALAKPKLRVEQPKPLAVRVTNQAAVRAPSAAAPAQTVATVRGGGVISRPSSLPAMADDGPRLASGNGMGGAFSGGSGLGNLGSSSVRVVEATPARAAGPLKISSGVIAGLLLAPIRPVYPAIAKASHTQGTVVLSAVIDRTGRITGLQVVSGPEMLRSAALEAVQTARYQPYRLNGETTDVVTTISVVFRMES